MTVHLSAARVAIVGAGIAGLAAARVLADAGARVTLLDKGRAPGGRASTRRRDAHRFDHGAQYLTARDAGFRALVAAWARRGVVAEWAGTFAAVDRPGELSAVARDEPRWVGVPGMSAVPRALATSLGDRVDLRAGTRVTQAVHEARGWRLQCEGDAAPLCCDALLVCVPAPQALDLLAGRTALEPDLRRATTTPCWSAMLAFDARLPIDADGLFVNVPDAPLAWAARDSSKPGRPDGERWVLHATPAWSQAHLDAAPDAVHRALLAALADATRRALPPPTYADAHRWRFARGALEPAPGALVDPEARLAVAGDWCAGGRVEGAWLSGVRAASAVAAALDA